MEIELAILIIVVFAVLAIWTLRSGKAKATLKFLKTKMEFERSDLEEQPETVASNKFEAGPNSTAKDVKQKIITPKAGKNENIATTKEKSKVEGVDQQIKGK